MSHVAIELASNGDMMMIEPELRAGLMRRVFRCLPDGALEYTPLVEWRESGLRARFYGFASRELPDSMTCKDS